MPVVLLLARGILAVKLGCIWLHASQSAPFCFFICGWSARAALLFLIGPAASVLWRLWPRIQTVHQATTLATTYYKQPNYSKWVKIT